MPIASIVDWYGPYKSYDHLIREARQIDSKRCLYMGVGVSGGRKQVLYLGLSTRIGTRFYGHHVLKTPRIVRYYIGEITTSGIPGSRRKKVPTDLDATEHALISYIRPELNTRRKETLPEDCVSVFSRFFGKNNWDKPKNTPPFFPSIIAYNSYSGEWLPARDKS